MVMDGKNEADWDGEGGYGENEGNEEQGTIATHAPVVVSGPTGLAPTLSKALRFDRHVFL